MNTKHSFWNRLFAALLLAVMLVTQTTTAFAVEDSPEPTEPSMVQAQDSDTGTEEAGEGVLIPLKAEACQRGQKQPYRQFPVWKNCFRQSNRRKPGPPSGLDVKSSARMERFLVTHTSGLHFREQPRKAISAPIPRMELEM